MVTLLIREHAQNVFFKLTVNRQSNFLSNCYLGCHATFLIITSDCVTVLVTVGKRSETLSKFIANFLFYVHNVFIFFTNPHKFSNSCRKLQIF